MNPDTTRPAANDNSNIATRIDPTHDTFTAFVRVPRGTPVTLIEADDSGPWWSAISGAIAFNALVWILALVISG